MNEEGENPKKIRIAYYNKRDVTEEHEYSWQILPNHSFWGETSGGIALFCQPPNDEGFGKPVLYMSRRQFEEQYPTEIEAT